MALLGGALVAFGAFRPGGKTPPNQFARLF